MPDPDEQEDQLADDLAEDQVADGTDASSDRSPGRARRAALVGLRVVAGTAGIVASVAIIGAVGLLPLPSHRIAVPTVTVTPDPTDQLRVCPGALLRLGDESGQNANSASSLGAPAVTGGGIGADLVSHPTNSPSRRRPARPLRVRSLRWPTHRTTPASPPPPAPNRAARSGWWAVPPRSDAPLS
jgi:hypothetical protein